MNRGPWEASAELTLTRGSGKSDHVVITLELARAMQTPGSSLRVLLLRVGNLVHSRSREESGVWGEEEGMASVPAGAVRGT